MQNYMVKVNITVMSANKIKALLDYYTIWHLLKNCVESNIHGPYKEIPLNQKVIETISYSF